MARLMPNRDDHPVGVLRVTAFEKRTTGQAAMCGAFERNDVLTPRLIEHKTLNDDVLSGNLNKYVTG